MTCVAYAHLQGRRKAAKAAAGHAPSPTVRVNDASTSNDVSPAAEAGAAFVDNKVNAA